MQTAVEALCSTNGSKFNFQIGPLKLQFVSFNKSVLDDRQLVGTYATSYKAACYCFIFSLNEWKCIFVLFVKRSFYTDTKTTCAKQPSCTLDVWLIMIPLWGSYKLKAACLVTFISTTVIIYRAITGESRMLPRMTKELLNQVPLESWLQFRGISLLQILQTAALFEGLMRTKTKR